MSMKFEILEYILLGDPKHPSNHAFLISVAFLNPTFSVQRSISNILSFDGRIRRKFPRSSIPELPFQNHQSFLTLMRAKLSTSYNSVTQSSHDSPIFRIQIQLCNYFNHLLNLPEIILCDDFINFFDSESSGGESISTNETSAIDLLIVGEDMQHKVVSRDFIKTINIQENQILLWYFSTISKDIGFHIDFNNKSILPYQRYNSHEHIIQGIYESTSDERYKSIVEVHSANNIIQHIKSNSSVDAVTLLDMQLQLQQLQNDNLKLTHLLSKTEKELIQERVASSRVIEEQESLQNINNINEERINMQNEEIEYLHYLLISQNMIIQNKSLTSNSNSNLNTKFNSFSPCKSLSSILNTTTTTNYSNNIDNNIDNNSLKDIQKQEIRFNLYQKKIQSLQKELWNLHESYEYAQEYILKLQKERKELKMIAIHFRNELKNTSNDINSDDNNRNSSNNNDDDGNDHNDQQCLKPFSTPKSSMVHSNTNTFEIHSNSSSSSSLSLIYKSSSLDDGNISSNSTHATNHHKSSTSTKTSTSTYHLSKEGILHSPERRCISEKNENIEDNQFKNKSSSSKLNSLGKSIWDLIPEKKDIFNIRKDRSSSSQPLSVTGFRENNIVINTVNNNNNNNNVNNSVYNDNNSVYNDNNNDVDDKSSSFEDKIMELHLF
eukprot:gene4746-9426_t